MDKQIRPVRVYDSRSNAMAVIVTDVSSNVIVGEFYKKEWQDASLESRVTAFTDYAKTAGCFCHAAYGLHAWSVIGDEIESYDLAGEPKTPFEAGREKLFSLLQDAIRDTGLAIVDGDDESAIVRDKANPWIPDLTVTITNAEE